jgi:chloramphenicol 3-O-phosphotransferase
VSSTLFVLLVVLLGPTAVGVGIAVAVAIVKHELDRHRGDRRPGYLIDPARDASRNGHVDRDRISHD